MMVDPGMDALLPQVDSKYTLVSVSSKRARKIMEKNDSSLGLENPVTVALHEIAEGKIQWVRTENMDDAAEEIAEEAAEEISEEVTEETEAPEEAVATEEADD